MYHMSDVTYHVSHVTCHLSDILLSLPSPSSLTLTEVPRKLLWILGKKLWVEICKIWLTLRKKFQICTCKLDNSCFSSHILILWGALLVFLIQFHVQNYWNWIFYRAKKNKKNICTQKIKPLPFGNWPKVAKILFLLSSWNEKKLMKNIFKLLLG